MGRTVGRFGSRTVGVAGIAGNAGNAFRRVLGWRRASRSSITDDLPIDVAPIGSAFERWQPPESALPDLIRARLTAGAARADDGIKLGLAVEGGGMRGIVSGGMLLALMDLGLLDAFDAFYGTSSGSVNIAYVMGGSSWDAMTVYYDHLTNGFLRRDKWNPTTPLLDMDYAFDQVIGRTVPIGWEALRRSERPINAVLTNMDAVRPELIDLRYVGTSATHESQVSISGTGDHRVSSRATEDGAGAGTADKVGVQLLKASAWMPMIAGRPPAINGTRYLDGALLCPDPVYAATRDGCTHVLLLNSSPQGAWPAVPRSRPLLRPILDRWAKGLGDEYVRIRAAWDADRAQARFDRDVTVDGATVLRVAAPAGAHRVHQLTMRRDTLLDGALAGYATIARLFGANMRAYFSITLR